MELQVGSLKDWYFDNVDKLLFHINQKRDRNIERVQKIPTLVIKKRYLYRIHSHEMYNKNIFKKNNKKYYEQFYAYKFNNLSRCTNSLGVGSGELHKKK